MNGNKVPAAVTGNLVVTYKGRNRQTEERIYFQDDATVIDKEADSVYRVFLYRHDGVLLASSGDISTLTHTFLATAVPGGIPTAGYVQVETFRTGVGAGQRTTLWFGAAVDYALTSDGAPQRVLDEANPWSFWRMSD